VTPLNIAICIAVDNILEDGQAASGLAISGSATGDEDVRRVTVVLNGVIYDGVVSAHASTAEVAVPGLAHATLPDGDYAVTTEVSASPRLTLLTTSAGNNIVASLTLERCGTADLQSGRLSLGFSAPPGLPNVASGQHLSLAESGHTWVPHSTRRPTSKHATLTIRNAAGGIVIPSNIVLTPRVLLGALVRLPTRQIEDAVEVLVGVLFDRYGDPDLEVDPDAEDGDGV
jgi:hypothetical protein